METATKICHKCGEHKPYGSFRKNKRRKDGLDTSCKTCESKRIRLLRTPTEDRKSKQEVYRNSNLDQSGEYLKRCPSCNQRKLMSCFSRSAYTVDGLDHKCKRCFNAVRAERNKKLAESVTTRIVYCGAKVCSKCKRTLSVDEFNFRKAAPDGRQARCRGCQKITHSQHYRDNRDYHLRRSSDYKKEHEKETKAYRRLRYQRNMEKEKEQVRVWERENPDKKAANDRRYYLKHSEAVKTRVKKWAIKNSHLTRLYRKRWVSRNPDKIREMKHRRRAREHSTVVGEVDYQFIWARDKGLCHICGKIVRSRDRSFDHVIPLARGGVHASSNIKIAHLKCNILKGVKLMSELNISDFVTLYDTDGESLPEFYNMPRLPFPNFEW